MTPVAINYWDCHEPDTPKWHVKHLLTVLWGRYYYSALLHVSLRQTQRIHICSMACRRLIFTNNIFLAGKLDVDLGKLAKRSGLLMFYTNWGYWMFIQWWVPRLLRVYAVG